MTIAHTARAFAKSDMMAMHGFDMGPEPAMGITLLNDADGSILSYTCVYSVNQHDWLFFWWSPDHPRDVMLLHRNARHFFALLKENYFTEIFAVCDFNVPRASKWLERLGFTPLAEDEKDAAIVAHEKAENQRVYKLWLN